MLWSLNGTDGLNINSRDVDKTQGKNIRDTVTRGKGSQIIKKMFSDWLDDLSNS